MLELAVRVIGRVEFDESWSPKAGGLIGAFRKKGILGFGRKKKKQRREKSKRRSASAGHPAPTAPNVGILSPNDSYGRNVDQEEDDGGYIMSAWNGRPTDSNGSGYMAPGAYSAPQGSASSQQAPSGFSVVRGGRATESNPYTFRSDGLPPGAAARPAYPSKPSSTRIPQAIDPLDATSDAMERSNLRRGRAASQSAIVEFFKDGETSPTTEARRRDYYSDSPQDPRRMSAPLPLSPRVTSNSRRPVSGVSATHWKRESSTGSGFFHNLFRGNTKSGEGGEGDDWTDSDESDVETLEKTRKRWPFNQNKGKRKYSNEAMTMQNIQNAIRDPDEEENRALDEWQKAVVDESANNGQPSAGPSTGKSFVVIRQPVIR